MKKAKKEKLAVSAKAARILRKVAAHILEEPRRFDMAEWIVKWDGRGGLPTGNASELERLRAKDYTPPACKTTACIAGWTCRLMGKRPKEQYGIVAGKLLGIDYMKQDSLFFDYNWPQPYRGNYLAAGGITERAKIAAARIEHFIKTGE